MASDFVTRKVEVCEKLECFWRMSSKRSAKGKKELPAPSRTMQINEMTECVNSNHTFDVHCVRYSTYSVVFLCGPGSGGNSLHF